MIIVNGPTRSGWSKRFSDGTIEHGMDEDVRFGKASWSKGRLEGMISATIYVAGEGFTLESVNGPATFHQSDDYESVPGQGTKLLRRRLQMCISNIDATYAELTGDMAEGGHDYEHWYNPPAPQVQWATIEVNVETGEMEQYLFPKRK